MRIGIIREWSVQPNGQYSPDIREMLAYEYLRKLGVQVDFIDEKEDYHQNGVEQYDVLDLMEIGREPQLKFLLDKKLIDRVPMVTSVLENNPSAYIFPDTVPMFLVFEKDNEAMFIKNIKTVFMGFERSYSVMKKFVVRCSYTKDILTSMRIPWDKISVIPNAVDIDYFCPNTKSYKLLEQLNIPKEGKIVLFVGRIDKDKGISLFVDTLAKIIEEDKNYYGILVGDSAMTTGFKGAVKSYVKTIGLEKHFIFVPKIKREDLLLFYNLADVFLSPQYYPQQYDYAMTEALSCGVPLVSMNYGSAKDFIIHKRGGYICNTYEELKEGVLYCSNDKDNNQYMQGKAREFALQHFKPEIVAQQLKSLYEEVIASV